MLGFPGSSAGKESTCNAGDPDSIPGLGICAREEIGFTPVFLGFCNGSATKESACNADDVGLIPELERLPWKRIWQPTPVFLPRISHGQRSLAGYNP